MEVGCLVPVTGASVMVIRCILGFTPAEFGGECGASVALECLEVGQWPQVPGSRPWAGVWFLARTRTSRASAEPFDSRSCCRDVSSAPGGRWPRRRRWKRPSGPQPPFS